MEEDLPVIEECAATFDGQDGRPHAFYVYTGTPLSNQNIIQKQFNLSKKWQWNMQCPHCSIGTGKYLPKKKDFYKREIRKYGWNDPIGMGNVDPKRPSLFCQHCGQNMNVPPGAHPDKRIPPWGQMTRTTR